MSECTDPAKTELLAFQNDIWKLIETMEKDTERVARLTELVYGTYKKAPEVKDEPLC